MTRRELLARFCLAFGSASVVASARAAHVAAEAPARIVSVVPSATEILFAIGAGSRVVGVGSYDRYPPETARLPKLGGLLDPNVERLFALKPDLAIVYGTQVELKRELERAGIPMFLYVHHGLPDITRTIRELGTRIGAAATASVLATRIESQLSAIRGRVAGRPRPKTLLVLGREPGTLRNLYASGGVGFLHDLLELAGGADAVGDVKRESVDVSTETILSRAPEVIVELHYGSELNTDRLDSERRVWDRLGSVPAVKSHRVYLLVGDEFVVPGPRIATAAERLARTLHPEAW
jgi:iron complex transport system substrate-binding protein